jgi:hypothetical protein
MTPARTVRLRDAAPQLAEMRAPEPLEQAPEPGPAHSGASLPEEQALAPVVAEVA